MLVHSTLFRVSRRLVLVGAVVVPLALPASPAWSQDTGAQDTSENRERPEPDLDDIMSELTAQLTLTEEQVPQVKTAIATYVKELEKTQAKHDTAEPDPQKMIGDMKKVRATYHKSLQQVLTSEQWSAYQAYVDQVMREIMTEVAAIRLIDMQHPLNLTDEQIDELAPILGTSMLKVIRVAFENADKRLNLRQKLKVARSLKKIQSDLKAGFQKVLTKEQQQAWQKYREQRSKQKG